MTHQRKEIRDKVGNHFSYELEWKVAAFLTSGGTESGIPKML